MQWKAPELMSGQEPNVTEASLVYGVGMLLWELLTGAVPFLNFEGPALMKIASHVDNWLRVTPDSPLWDLLRACVATRPEERLTLARLGQQLYLLASRDPLDDGDSAKALSPHLLVAAAPVPEAVGAANLLVVEQAKRDTPATPAAELKDSQSSPRNDAAKSHASAPLPSGADATTLRASDINGTKDPAPNEKKTMGQKLQKSAAARTPLKEGNKAGASCDATDSSASDDDAAPDPSADAQK
jgi:serine/threonine protein kinase